jgi:DNA-binding transcriptional ArsR family regulator
MAKNRYIMFSMDDERIKNLAGVLGNKTCESIIDYLEKNDEASAKDISDALKLPMNTVDYNIKKLVESGIVEKKKKFFWSVKGKKIVTYGLSNKSIVISPKKTSVSSKLKSVVPAVLIAGIGTALVSWFTKPRFPVFEESKEAVLGTMESATTEVQSTGADLVRDATINNINIFTESVFYTPIWVWFLAGALVVLLVFSILNWRKL